MSFSYGTYRFVEELHDQFTQRGETIRERLHDFAHVKSEEYYYELAYCLLTPQSNAFHAAAVIDQLKAVDFLNRDVEPTPFLYQKSQYIRFHNTKAKRLIEAKLLFPQVAAVLSHDASSQELRSWLVHHVNGLGWKEASHFLRNIGHLHLAILDRHILRNLVRHRVLRSIPRTLTPRRYTAIEVKFATFADAVGISMDELDLLFWSKETGTVFK